jgi:hypothetical protein
MSESSVHLKIKSIHKLLFIITLMNRKFFNFVILKKLDFFKLNQINIFWRSKGSKKSMTCFSNCNKNLNNHLYYNTLILSVCVCVTSYRLSPYIWYKLKIGVIRSIMTWGGAIGEKIFKKWLMTKLPSKKNTHSMILYGKNLFVFMFDLNYFASTSSSGVVRGNLNDGHEDLLECH